MKTKRCLHLGAFKNKLRNVTENFSTISTKNINFINKINYLLLKVNFRFWL